MRLSHLIPLVAALVVLTGCVPAGPTSSADGASEGVAAAADGPIDFELPDLDGRPVKLSDFDGRIRLVDFWTTWCPPCRDEIPMFMELQAQYEPDGFTMIAVALDEDGVDVVKPFVEGEQVTYLNLIGNDEVTEKFGGIPGYPTAFLIDREGNVIDQMYGPKPRKILEGKIRAALGLDGA